LTESDRCKWLGLITAPGLDVAARIELVRRFGTPDAILAAGPAALKAAGLPPQTVESILAPELEQIAACRAWLAEPDHHLLPCWEQRYPEQLAEARGAPGALFVDGDPAVLGLPQIAVVGSRSASSAGKATAREFSAALTQLGIGITSGLALGIDAAAHQGALEAGGITVAVCATGLDIVYPRDNVDLAGRIARQGALVSELVPGTPPRRSQFPSRNRIISGLSLGTLVVEAGSRSGALITARHAGEQGREVFAIPGSIHNPLARGCHALIRQGAKLVETVDDIISELRQAISLPDALSGAKTGTAKPPESPVTYDSEYMSLLDALGYGAVSVDEAAQRTGLTTAEVSSMLLRLELEGHVEVLPGGRYQRVPEQRQ
jgi:DNA processing protein